MDDSTVVPLEDIKVVDLVKVRWQHRKGLEWTWESKDKIREHYLELFGAVDFKDEI